MNIFVLCVTHRGELFLNRLFQLCPSDDFYVFTFRETSHEPKYFDKIKTLATSHSARFFETTNVAHKKFDKLWASVKPDIIFVVSWRYMIPMEIANKAEIACIVFHDSLLPFYKGFSPTVWAIINGENKTGVTMFHLAKDVDAGDIIDQSPVSIGPDDNIKEVIEAVTNKYLVLLEKNLPLIINGQAPRIPQDHPKSTFTCKRIPEDNEICWTCSAAEIYNLIRAVTHPYPGSYTWLNGQKVIVWSASRPEKQRKYVGCVPGAILEIRKDNGVIVLTGDGQLCLNYVQLDGQEKVCASNVLNRLSYRLGK